MNNTICEEEFGSGYCCGMVQNKHSFRVEGPQCAKRSITSLYHMFDSHYFACFDQDILDKENMCTSYRDCYVNKNFYSL